MTRLLVLAPLLAFMACGSGTPARSPEAAYAAHLAAVEARDAEAAYDALAEAADGGHLDALARQIHAHRMGYVRPAPGVDAPNLPVRTPMWRLGSIERRYDRAVRDSAVAGTPGGLRHAAFGLAGDLVTRDGVTESSMDPADRDSVEALYRRLVPMGGPRHPLAVLAWHLGLEDERDARLDEAVAAAEPGACWQRMWLSGDHPDLSTPAGFAAYLDRMEACPRRAEGPDPAAEDIAALVARAADGNEASAAFLDALWAEGVAERHPRLAALLPDARP